MCVPEDDMRTRHILRTISTDRSFSMHRAVLMGRTHTHTSPHTYDTKPFDHLDVHALDSRERYRCPIVPVSLAVIESQLLADGNVTCRIEAHVLLTLLAHALDLNDEVWIAR